jgi:hypothetical protein
MAFDKLWIAQPDGSSQPPTTGWEASMISSVLQNFFDPVLREMKQNAAKLSPGRDPVAWDKDSGEPVYSWDEYSTIRTSIYRLNDVDVWELRDKVLHVTQSPMAYEESQEAIYQLAFGDTGYTCEIRIFLDKTSGENRGFVSAANICHPITEIIKQLESRSKPQPKEPARPLEELYPDNPNVGAFS